jgi:hypothetical protein
VFTSRANYQREAEVAIRLQHSIGMCRFAVLLVDDAFGRDVHEGIDRAVKALELPPPAIARIDNRKPDVGPALAALLPQAPQATRAGLIEALEGLGEVVLGGHRLRYGPGERSGSSCVEPTIITHGGKFMR